MVASANLVTYQVNMGTQITLGNFNPGSGDRVMVAGNYSNPDWVTTNALTASIGDTNIYVGTFNNDMGTDSFENHKFIIDVGGTQATLNWETIANRFFQVTAGDQTLPVVYFNDVTSASSLRTNDVKFQVNIGTQIALGNFNPASDFVYVAGDAVNNWVAGATTLSPNGGDANIYEGTVSITNTIGSTVNYKFIMNTSVQGQIWENNGVGPNGAQNRQFTFPATSTNLPLVYFNNITNSSSLITTQITFNVNLAAQIALGTFDPNGGTVSVAGDAINNWSPTASPLTPSPTISNLWSATLDVTSTVGGPVNYKFVLNTGGTWENNGVGPGGANDRQLIFPSSATNLPSVYFNNLGDLGRLTNGPVINGQITLSWAAGPLVRLQTNSTLTGTWGDVPGSVGVGTMDFGVGAGNTHFRLIGP